MVTHVLVNYLKKEEMEYPLYRFVYKYYKKKFN